MALPHLIKYIYNNGTDEVIRRGKKIHAIGNVELVEHDDLTGSVVFRVKDDSYSTYYKVYISKFKDQKDVSIRCGCPYNLGEICRHEAAALFQLQDMVDKNMLGEKETLYDQKHTVIKMKQLELKMIKLLTSPVSLKDAEEYLRGNRANFVSAKDERVDAELEVNGEKYQVVVQKNEERNFDTSCTCGSKENHPLCLHKTIVLLQLLHAFGPGYFDTIRNLDKEKNKLLAIYGYSLEDDLSGKFEFLLKEGKPFLKVLDPSIKRIATAPPSTMPRPPREETPVPVSEEPEMKKENLSATKLGTVIVNNPHQYPFVQLDVVSGETNETHTAFAGKTEKIDLGKYVNTEALDEEDKTIVQQLRKLLPGEVSRYLNRNSPFSGIWENIVQQHDDQLPEETRHLIAEYLHPKYKKLFTELANSLFVYYLPKGKPFNTGNLKQAITSSRFIVPEFKVTHENDRYLIDCYTRTEIGEVNVADNQHDSALILQSGNHFFLWDKAEHITLVERFLPSGKIVIDKEDWNSQLQEFILPLAKEYSVHFSNLRKEEIKDIKPEVKLLLKEKGDYLLFEPVFNYKGYDVRKGDKEKVIIPVSDRLLIIQRNMEAENQFIDKIENLHSNFIRPEQNHVLALKGSDVLKNNWFFLFVDAMRDMNVPVYGFEALKNFRFNTAKPSTKIYISSHTDWFDAKVEILFGEQKVTVADVKKALANKQQFVPLNDGTLGILPEEWIKRYSLLFRVGEGRAGNLKLSQYHFGVIEELYEERNEEELFFQLEEKYDNIRGHHTIKPVPAPAHLQPILRPYQESGFQWLNYLSEVKWGGILADDMGLGKTIQALSFLQHLKDEQETLKALVVCPTTLMYNWENEIKKFTPSLTDVFRDLPSYLVQLYRNIREALLFFDNGGAVAYLPQFHKAL